MGSFQPSSPGHFEDSAAQELDLAQKGGAFEFFVVSVGAGDEKELLLGGVGEAVESFEVECGAVGRVEFDHVAREFEIESSETQAVGLNEAAWGVIAGHAFRKLQGALLSPGDHAAVPKEEERVFCFGLLTFAAREANFVDADEAFFQIGQALDTLLECG